MQLIKCFFLCASNSQVAEDYALNVFGYAQSSFEYAGLLADFINKYDTNGGKATAEQNILPTTEQPYSGDYFPATDTENLFLKKDSSLDAVGSGDESGSGAPPAPMTLSQFKKEFEDMTPVNLKKVINAAVKELVDRFASVSETADQSARVEQLERDLEKTKALLTTAMGWEMTSLPKRRRRK